jgi:hypothetical protein
VHQQTPERQCSSKSSSISTSSRRMRPMCRPTPRPRCDVARNLHSVICANRLTYIWGIHVQASQGMSLPLIA